MTLFHELQHKIRQFVKGDISIKDLDLWISARVQAVQDAREIELRDLYYFTWGLVDYWMVGDIDEAAVRAELEAAVSSLPTASHP